MDKLTAAFAEVRRVLRCDGILWLNIGDGFTSGNRGWRAPDKKNPNRAMAVRPDNPPGLKDKDLLGVPWRLAVALQASGWFLRTDIIWHKPNAMPESVKDRPTRAHEYLFMLTKSERCAYFRPDREPDGPLLVFGAHVAIGLGDSEGVVEQALRHALISPDLASGLKSARSEGPPLLEDHAKKRQPRRWGLGPWVWGSTKTPAQPLQPAVKTDFS